MAEDDTPLETGEGDALPFPIPLEAVGVNDTGMVYTSSAPGVALHNGKEEPLQLSSGVTYLGDGIGGPTHEIPVDIQSSQFGTPNEMPRTITEFKFDIQAEINSAKSVQTRFSHYYRPCPYDAVDIYRVLTIFEVADPCIQHAVKKLLVAGGRGHKDITKDIAEAIASLQRWQQMRDEEIF